MSVILAFIVAFATVLT